MNDSNNLVKPTLQITIFSVIGIIINLVSQLFIAYFFGTKFERDAYFVAVTIPTYVSSVFIGSFGLIFLPKVVDILKRRNDEETGKFISTIFCFLFFLLSLITLMCFVFVYRITHFFAPGYSQDQVLFTGKILFIIMPAIIFLVLGNLLASLYQIQHSFIRPALAQIISLTTSLLLVILLSDRIGIFGLAYGYLMGSIVTFFILLPILKNYNFGFYIYIRSIDVYSFMKTLAPLMLTGILFRMTVVFERMIASNLPQGSISYLGYTNQILAILSLLVARGIAVSTYPTLSQLWSENETFKFSIIFLKTLQIILLISIPISITIVFFGDELVKVVFERGVFDSISTIAVSKALCFSVLAFISQSLGSVVAKVLYISGRTFVASLISTIEIIIYLLLGLTLSKYYSFSGLSIALSISCSINIVISLVFINNRLVKLNIAKLLIYASKISVASLCGIISAYLIYHNLFKDQIYLSILAAIAIIFASGLILKIEEIQFIYNIINKKMR